MNAKKPKNQIGNYKIIEEKIMYFQDIIRNTILSCQKYKNMDILGANEINVCIQSLENLFIELNTLLTHIRENVSMCQQVILNSLQKVNAELSGIIKSFGTQNFDDLITICLGTDFVTKNFKTKEQIDKYELITKYVHPINYKVYPWKKIDANSGATKSGVLQKNRIIEDSAIVEQSNLLDCFDLARTSKNFQTRVYGVKVSIQDISQKQTIIIYCVADDLILECLNYPYIINKMTLLKSEKPSDADFTADSWDRFLQSMTLKDIIIYDNKEIYDKYIGYINQLNLIKQKTIAQVVKEFVGSELYNQRLTLIQLLLKATDNEYQYLAYLLYDLLSNDSNNLVDTQEQTLLFDSLPWNAKKYFRDAMKQTIEYTNNLANFDNNKIPLEQQICLMKATDNVKEKAMQKLKEVKSKSDDSGSKARQYLDGLLKIPFGIFKEETILHKMGEVHNQFNELIASVNDLDGLNIPVKDKYTSIEIHNHLATMKNTSMGLINDKIKTFCIEQLTNHACRQDIVTSCFFLNTLMKKYNQKKCKICLSGKNIGNIKEQIITLINAIDNKEIINEIVTRYNYEKYNYNVLNNINTHITNIEGAQNEITEYIGDISKTLDGAVHGHKTAKRQVERIIGQWINGEKTGYCFGFEGAAGLGKTTLAKKGIANCLLDENGESRPFSFIAVGGSSNGSTLDGHNYTYVGSTWGKIVDVLIEKKCMNPIIFIDELDKVSRTEHGKEIIGILIHLIDSTQNDSFQDKYFNGVDLDLSKVLFIFSYNDPDAIDRILLDRIHRVKFDHLTLDDKIVITNDYLLPEIYKKMGLEGTIQMDDSVIEFIVSHYTYESGVRKLKELLFEIVAEINLTILTEKTTLELPIIIDIDTIKNVYLKERHEINPAKIISAPHVGIINGLWANSLGKGGILHVEANFYATSTFLDLKLTGMQGDVMKESMNVAKTLAWSMLDKKTMKKYLKEFEETKMQGIHIHAPDGATPKDGPSAGTAITTALYSLLTNRKIKNDVAITGEICLQGNVTAIGGLDLKILGGLIAGVKTFMYPKDNHKDFGLFMEKYAGKDIFDGISFIEVEHITDVLKHVFV
jgi:ATP-dependent Lon protease